MEGVNLIAAVSLDGKIGHDGEMLWHLQEDMDYYKRITTGNILIVGPKTYYGLPEKALRERTHIVLMNDDPRPIENRFDTEVYALSGNEKAIKKALQIKKENQRIFVIGGSKVYKEMLPFVDNVYITWINNIYENTNKEFPIDELHRDFHISEDTGWRRTKDRRRYKFVTYKRTWQ